MAIALWFGAWCAILTYVGGWIISTDPGNWFTIAVGLWPVYYAGKFGLRACDIYVSQQKEMPDIRQRYLQSRLLYMPRGGEQRHHRQDD